MTLAPPPLSEASSFTAEALIAANIDPDTWLATDYLNHFNEVVMMLDLLGDMPELRDEVLAWAPASYQEHFERSSFRAKALAIAAYGFAPAAARGPFDALTVEIDALLLAAQAELASADPEDVARLGPATAAMVQPLLMRLGGLVHGAPGKARSHADDQRAPATNAPPQLEAAP
jgi:hypothetical protein